VVPGRTSGRHLTGGGAPGLQLVAPCLAATEEQALADLAAIESCPVLDRAEVAVEHQATDARDLTAASALTYPEEHRYAVDNMWTSASAAELLPGYRRIAETIPASGISWGLPKVKSEMPGSNRRAA